MSSSPLINCITGLQLSQTVFLKDSPEDLVSHAGTYCIPHSVPLHLSVYPMNDPRIEYHF